jgi:hypothetical protein
MFTTQFTRRQMLALMGSLGLVAAVAAAPPLDPKPRRPVDPKPLDPKPQPGLFPYEAHVLSLKPAGYWRLGEAKGPTARDSSGNRHDGTYHGAFQFHEPGALKDDPNTSVLLEGKSFVEILNNKAFSVSDKGLTVETWLRLTELDFPGQTGAGDEPYIHWLGKGEKDEFEWGFRLYSKHKKDGQLSGRANRISAYIWNPKSAARDASNEGAGAYFQDELVVNQWMHIVATYDPPGKGAGVRIYRDGVLRKGPPDSGTLYSTFNVTPVHGTAPVRLGTRDKVSFLRGGLDEVAIYPRVLTAAEIKKSFELGSGAHKTR